MQLSLHLTNFIQLWEYVAEKSSLILGILRSLDPQVKTSQSKDQVKNLKLKFFTQSTESLPETKIRLFALFELVEHFAEFFPINLTHSK